MKDVVIYTDGACSGNPGKGGYGVVLIYKNIRKEISDGFELTTNNRMEVMAVIAGLEALKESCNVKLYSDSNYVIDAINKGWLQSWKKNKWFKSNKEKVLNVDLWERLLRLTDLHRVEFIKVKGHSGITENEVCDELARNAITKSKLKVDYKYIEYKDKYG